MNSHPFGSARSRPGREAAKRTLDGEDRSGIIQGEGKEIDFGSLRTGFNPAAAHGVFKPIRDAVSGDRRPAVVPTTGWRGWWE